MLDIYRIMIVDDGVDDMKLIMSVIKRELEAEKIFIEYNVISKQDEVDKLKEELADVVMFDCSLSGAALKFGDMDKSRYGFELLKEFRENNKKTKVIFYSGSFNLNNDVDLGFMDVEIVQIINELNIYKITNRKVENLIDALKSTILSIDPVLKGLVDMQREYGDLVTINFSEESLTIADLVSEIKMDSKLGKEFSKEMIKIISTYFINLGGGN